MYSIFRCSRKYRARVIDLVARSVIFNIKLLRLLSSERVNIALCCYVSVSIVRYTVHVFCTTGQHHSFEADRAPAKLNT